MECIEVGGWRDSGSATTVSDARRLSMPTRYDDSALESSGLLKCEMVQACKFAYDAVGKSTLPEKINPSWEDLLFFSPKKGS